MQKLIAPIIAMISVVVASNFLVNIPINDWLTWGALTYPISFLITDITNRMHGAIVARRVVYVGFACAVVVSALLVSPRIAFASGSAFVIGQLLDIVIFNYLRKMAWWKPPFVSSTAGSFIDTCVFFSLAFAGTDMPWVTLAIGDFGVKLALAIIFLAPFRAFFALFAQRAEA
ncbi:MAG: queuosine precursor transporter [Alphaproteobacteria bacterium]|nr:queuosine precursor transporter [Alphaproteobacteria bacterium]